MKVKVKICGIKTLEAAKNSIPAGADFLGFNFVPVSKRYIRPAEAKKIIDELPKSVMKVGVFRDTDISEINNLINFLGLDYVQLHGNKSREYLDLIKGARIIKTLSLFSDFDIEETKKKMKKYDVDYYLLDREVQGRGELLNPERVRELTSLFPIILAGGLIVDNVADYIHLTKPIAVDVAGGVETNGEKDREKIIKFVKEAKQYDI